VVVDESGGDKNSSSVVSRHGVKLRGGMFGGYEIKLCQEWKKWGAERFEKNYFDSLEGCVKAKREWEKEEEKVGKGEKQKKEKETEKEKEKDKEKETVKEEDKDNKDENNNEAKTVVEVNDTPKEKATTEKTPQKNTFVSVKKHISKIKLGGKNTVLTKFLADEKSALGSEESESEESEEDEEEESDEEAEDEENGDNENSNGCDGDNENSVNSNSNASSVNSSKERSSRKQDFRKFPKVRLEQSVLEISRVPDPSAKKEGESKSGDGEEQSKQSKEEKAVVETWYTVAVESEEPKKVRKAVGRLWGIEKGGKEGKSKMRKEGKEKEAKGDKGGKSKKWKIKDVVRDVEAVIRGNDMTYRNSPDVFVGGYPIFLSTSFSGEGEAEGE
jgi:hypothetical protein